AGGEKPCRTRPLFARGCCRRSPLKPARPNPPEHRWSKNSRRKCLARSRIDRARSRKRAIADAINSLTFIFSLRERRTSLRQATARQARQRRRGLIRARRPMPAAPAFLSLDVGRWTFGVG